MQAGLCGQGWEPYLWRQQGLHQFKPALKAAHKFLFPLSLHSELFVFVKHLLLWQILEVKTALKCGGGFGVGFLLFFQKCQECSVSSAARQTGWLVPAGGKLLPGASAGTGGAGCFGKLGCMSMDGVTG